MVTADTQAQTRGERTRLAILEAAQELFLENGYDGTSMRLIAGRAGGIAVGSIYNHFSSKEDIFRKLVEARSPAPGIIAALEDAEGESGPQLLAHALRNLSAVAVEQIDFIHLAYIDIQKFDGAAMVGVLEKGVPAALKFARRVTEAGGLRAEVTPFVMMRVFISLMIGFALTQQVAFSEGRPRVDLIPKMPQDQWLDAFVDVYLHGVAER